MKANGDNLPDRFLVEPVPNKIGYVMVRFYENVVPFSKTIDGVTTSGYKYDEYHLELRYFPRLNEDINANYENYLQQAKMEEIAKRKFDPIDYENRKDAEADLSSLLVDQEYRMVLLELGI